MEPEPLNQRSKLILDTYNQQEDTRVWLKASNNQHSLITTTSATADTSINQHLQDTTPISDLLITPEFLRKYIYFAKNRIQPVLSDTAMELISQAYAEMRSKQTSRTLPVTARSLETIIRLANANAKCRLSQSVDEVDVEAALELMNFVLYHEVGATTDEGEGQTGTGIGQTGNDNNSSTIIDKENTPPSSHNNSTNKNRNLSNRRKRGKGQNYDHSMDTDADDEEEESNIYDKKTRIESLYDKDNNDNNNTTLTTLTTVDPTSTRHQYVMTNVLALSSVYGDNFTIHNVLEKINSSLSESNADPYAAAAGVLSPLSPAPAVGSSTGRGSSSGVGAGGVGGKYEYSELEGILKALEGENKVCIYACMYWYVCVYCILV